MHGCLRQTRERLHRARAPKPCRQRIRLEASPRPHDTPAYSTDRKTAGMNLWRNQPKKIPQEIGSNAFRK
jgi:hypothetical protein